MNKTTVSIIAIVFMAMTLFSCTTGKNCPTAVSKVEGFKAKEAPQVIEEDIVPEKVPEIKGDDQNKLLLQNEEEPLLIKNYFPRKYNLQENEFMETSVMPGEIAEFSFSTKQERGWRILIRNDDDIIWSGGFVVSYFLCSVEQPNIFVAVGAQKVKQKTTFLYESRKEEILKIVIKNDSDHLLLPLTIFPGQYTKRNKPSAMEVPQR